MFDVKDYEAMGGIAKRRRERRLRGSQDTMRQRIFDELRRGPQAKLLHSLSLMKFNGSR